MAEPSKEQKTPKAPKPPKPLAEVIDQVSRDFQAKVRDYNDLSFGQLRELQALMVDECNILTGKTKKQVHEKGRGALASVRYAIHTLVQSIVELNKTALTYRDGLHPKRDDADASQEKIVNQITQMVVNAGVPMEPDAYGKEHKKVSTDFQRIFPGAGQGSGPKKS